VTESPLQVKLELLRRQFTTLQQYAQDPGQARELLPGVLVDLQRSLEELQTSVAELPDDGTGSNNVRAEQRKALEGFPARQADARLALQHDAEQEVRLHRERLRSLMADLLVAEEHERRRLAVDLHDGLSQTIALTQIKLSALRASMDGRLDKALDEIEELIDQTDRAARSISFELSPPLLHDLGLEPAVQWLVENIQARYGIEIVLEDDGQPKPADEKTRVILFRSIRELLINAAKHAGARRVHVRLEREEDRLNAAVEDDGIGMEPDVAAVKGSGLFSISERLSHVGGSMRIESAPGRGTKIRLCAPLTRATKARVEA